MRACEALRGAGAPLLAALVAAACTGTPEAELKDGTALAGHPWDVAGFDAPGALETWRSGDRALYQVDYTDGERRHRWRIELVFDGPPVDGLTMTFDWSLGEVAERERTGVLGTTVHVTPVGGGEVGLSRSGLPQIYVERGLYASCVLAQEMFAEAEATSEPEGGASAPIQPDLEDARTFISGFLALTAFLDLVKDDEQLSDVLWEVIEKPSIFSVALRFGVKLSIEPDFENARRLEGALAPPLDGVPAYSLPVALSLNGARALDCELVACPPDPPLHAAAGLVRLVGRHPDHPEREVRIRLVSARRGAPPETAAGAP